MAEAQQAEPVKLFAAILLPRAITPHEDRWAQLVARLDEYWGALDFLGPDHSFDATDYYRDEMGDDLVRRIIAFEDLFPAENIGSAKHLSNQLEAEFAHSKGTDSQRVFNLDIGYLDHAKVVLPSMKAAGQKIYLGDGVYADPIARFENGQYQPFPWTFPDFRDGRYDAELNAIRAIYLQQLREHRASQ